MSGSGGGGGGGGGVDRQTPCSSLTFETSLSSPDPAVVSNLRVGDVLELVAETAKGPVLARTDNNRTAGSITASQLLRLLECLEEGNDFEAEVTSITGGDVRVLVRPR